MLPKYAPLRYAKVSMEQSCLSKLITDSVVRPQFLVVHHRSSPAATRRSRSPSAQVFSTVRYAACSFPATQKQPILDSEHFSFENAAITFLVAVAVHVFSTWLCVACSYFPLVNKTNNRF
jgi:hypothetical protein